MLQCSSLECPLIFRASNFDHFSLVYFCSKLAVFDGKKAIRGGIPFVFRKCAETFYFEFHYLYRISFDCMWFILVLSVCSAQFGPSSFGPQHGFARISRWTLERAPERLHNGDIEALFSLMDSEFTRSMWNFPWVIYAQTIILTFDLFNNNQNDLISDFELLIDWFYAKKNYISILVCSIQVKMLHFHSICCCTHI